MTTAVEITAAKHFIDKGLPVNGAVALTCVLYYESKLNPGSQGNQPTETGGVLNAHGAYGIASWNGPRQAGLNNYALKRGIPIESLPTQLDFVLNEIANHYPRSWAAIRSNGPSDIIIATLVDEYENPADKSKEIAGASGYAPSLLDAVKGYVPSAPLPVPPVPPQPVPVPPVSPVEDLQMPIELILQLIAPLAESLVTGLLKGALTHAAQTGTIPLPKVPPHPTIPGPPASGLTQGDFAKIAEMIAAAIAQLQQPAKPAA